MTLTVAIILLKNNINIFKNKDWLIFLSQSLLFTTHFFKMKKQLILCCTALILTAAAYAQSNLPPAWAKDAIWYQIFVERFYNGDKTNNPTVETTSVPNMHIVPPAGWQVSSWTSNWYMRQPWERDEKQDFSSILQFRRYGGDLQGVLDKLDYLQELGITAVYFNPLNDAPSLHKYDARHYHHIDINFGPDPEGDKRLIASENPTDPSTWQWTSADKLFLKLVYELHQRHIRVILDYSWNHTGTLFWAWQDILKNQAKSPYRDWYEITSFDNPDTPENEFSYKGWYGNAYMPELKKVDIATPRVNGLPYEGNINQGAKQHIFDVTRRWLAPDGDVSKGIDGYRLDVAEQIGLGFWRDYRAFVKNVNPQAYLIGEIWWEQWPQKLMNPQPYVQGDVFDAVMFYQVYKPARSFFLNSDDNIDARRLKDSLEFQWNRLPRENVYAMMNVSSTHDTPRLLSDFQNTNAYKFHANPHENPNYDTGKPDVVAYKRLRLYLIHLFTTIGAPQIWNGEEMGMWGADDPHCRKPLMWKEMKFEDEYRNNFQKGKKEYDKVAFNQVQFDLYKKLISIRKAHEVLKVGDIRFLYAEGKKFGYVRTSDTEKIIVLFNADSKVQLFDVKIKAKYTDILTGKIYRNRHIRLKGLDAMILRVN